MDLWRHDVAPGAEDLARQLDRLADDWEQALERRQEAGRAALERCEGPPADELDQALAIDRERGRRLAGRLRAEAGAWRAAAAAQAEAPAGPAGPSGLSDPSGSFDSSGPGAGWRP